MSFQASCVTCLPKMLYLSLRAPIESTINGVELLSDLRGSSQDFSPLIRENEAKYI